MGETSYTDPFWEGLSDGRFLVHGCADCGAVFFPPAPICPDCHSRAVDWEPSSGEGSLYSFTR